MSQLGSVPTAPRLAAMSVALLLLRVAWWIVAALLGVVLGLLLSALLLAAVSL